MGLFFFFVIAGVFLWLVYRYLFVKSESKKKESIRAAGKDSASNGFPRPKLEIQKAKIGQEVKSDAFEQPAEVIEKKISKDIFIKPSREVLNVQVGIDFGTAATKVCYSIVGSLSKVCPIVFSHSVSISPPYTFPTVVAFDSDKKPLLGARAEVVLENEKWGNGLRNFKTLLAGQYDSAFKDDFSEKLFYGYITERHLDPKITPDIVTALYLAYVINITRQSIQNKFANRDLNLSFNIGIPVDYIQNNPVNTRFENIFAVAESVEKKWYTSKSNINLLEEVLTVMDNVRYDENNPETRVFGIPEAVAELACYTNSTRRKEGLHALIDFGAGTTDVSIFNLTNLHKKQTWLYAVKVIPYGVFQIEKVLVSHLDGSVSYKKLHNIFNQLSSKKKEIFGLALDVKMKLQELRDSRAYKDIWGSAYMYHLKKESAWYDVKIFTGGGGSQLPFVKELFSIPWWEHISGKCSYDVEVLSRPDNFDADKNIPFYRMAVAYGLTIPKPQLNDYVLPKDAPDHTPVPRPKKLIPDREELYPK